MQDRRRQSMSRRVRDQPWARVLMLGDLYGTAAPVNGRILSYGPAETFGFGRIVPIWRATESSGIALENDIVYAALFADANRWEILRARRLCPCGRCTDSGGTPRTFSFTLFGRSYTLSRVPAAQDAVFLGTGEGALIESCQWALDLNEVIGCGTATRMVLVLSHISGGNDSVYYQLTITGTRTSDGVQDELYEFNSAELGTAGYGGIDVDCTATRTLTAASGTACSDGTTVDIVPGTIKAPCCGCADFDVGSSGIGIPDNGCCLTMPSAWNLEFPTAVWGNQSCANCTGVVGVFNLPFLDAPPLVGARYRYFNANWCTDTVVPCVGGPISLEITLVFTAGCGLRAQLNLDRQLLDHEVCAARCRIGYTATNFTPPRNCVASPITLTANNYPNANPCSSRTAGGPPPSPFDTLCDDYTDGAFPPEFITATAA